MYSDLFTGAAPANLPNANRVQQTAPRSSIQVTAPNPQRFAAPQPGNTGGVTLAATDTREPARPTAPVGPSEADLAAARKKALTESAISNTRKAIGSLDTEFTVGQKNINDSYKSLIGKYDREATRTEEDFQEGQVDNNQNLTRDRQNAYVAAAQGRRGLRGVLSSYGALSGDGSVLADQAVTRGANQDIGEASETFATNAQTLDKAKEGFDEEDEDRRLEAGTAKKNNITSLEGGIAAKRQTYLQKLADLFGDIDNNGKAEQYLDEAGDLNKTIAQKTAVASTPFAERSAAFTPGDLQEYLAGAGDRTVSVRGGAAGGSQPTILAGTQRDRRRDEELAVA